jgi:hypothetical protein
MRTLRAFALACTVAAISTAAHAADRFGRPIVKVRDHNAYKWIRVDDADYATQSNAHLTVSALVYRGTEHYYVDVIVTNNTDAPLTLPTDFVRFDKPGYIVTPSDPMVAAREVGSFGGMRFTPVPAPYVPPTYHTTVAATTYGNQTNYTATTTTDNSGQAGANLGNAIGNAIAAHRFYKAQRNAVAFANYLASHYQSMYDAPIPPAHWREIVTTFDQSKPKKHPFTVTVAVGADKFTFDYKE